VVPGFDDSCLRGAVRILPVLVLVLGFSRLLSATMIPIAPSGDILSGMWELISWVGRVPMTLVWGRESAIGRPGRVGVAAAFAEPLLRGSGSPRTGRVIDSGYVARSFGGAR
jgi:hypothetical protein